VHDARDLVGAERKSERRHAAREASHRSTLPYDGLPILGSLARGIRAIGEIRQWIAEADVGDGRATTLRTVTALTSGYVQLTACAFASSSRLRTDCGAVSDGETGEKEKASA
jgi:hypothetical protein